MLPVGLMAMFYGLALFLVVKSGRTAVGTGRISIGTYYTALAAFAVLGGVLLRLIRAWLQNP